MRIAVMITAGVGLLALAACSDDSATAPPAETAAVAEKLTPGEYEVTTTVEELRSTDNTTPLTKLKLTAAGDPPLSHRACIAADGSVATEMFSEAGDSCKVNNSYARNGKINAQLGCSRDGAPGNVMHSIDGEFTADGFTATVNTGTYFTGSGDYAMRRSLTARRVGACPAAGEKKS
jgi:hypothetical protein